MRQAFARDELDEYAWHDRGRQIALDIARGLHFLHTSGVIHRCWSLLYALDVQGQSGGHNPAAVVSDIHPAHRCRDLKTSNILLSAEGVAKIADVGLAKMLTNADQYSLDHTAGTFAYAAPELILGTRCSEKVRSLAACCSCCMSCV